LKNQGGITQISPRQVPAVPAQCNENRVLRAKNLHWPGPAMDHILANSPCRTGVLSGLVRAFERGDLEYLALITTCKRVVLDKARRDR
jgi:hypothetical protein